MPQANKQENASEKTIKHTPETGPKLIKNTGEENPYLNLDNEIIISDHVSLFGAKQEL